MASNVPAEKTNAELAAMTKDERTAYHKARMAAKAQPATPAEGEGLSKAEKREAARQKQEADRKRKEEAREKVGDNTEALAELKLQGLTEEQAKEVLALQMAANKTEEQADNTDDEEEDETLLGCVRSWMAAHDATDADNESLRDFNLKVRFQGHVDSTPPDHLECILHVIAEQVCTGFDLQAAKQPSAVSKAVASVFARWSYLLGELYTRCDAITGTDILLSALLSGIEESRVEMTDAVTDSVLVGMLMAIRDECENVEDDDLLTACKRLKSESKVMKGFVAFLESALESDDEEDDSDE